jgi:hypothetical protein
VAKTVRADQHSVLRVWRTATRGVARAVSPSEQVAAIKPAAREVPVCYGLPLARFSALSHISW